ncbi:MAG: hypothetical protein Q8N03_04460 [Ignavibacteria bacterium]|nr:hypothetical protein [Ignavibacteria bacterium]
MKFSLLSLHFLILTSVLFPQEELFDDPQQTSYGFELAPQTKYLWRGLSLDDGFVVQPDAWISWNNLTFEIWGNIAVFDKSTYDTTKNHELDIYLYYTYQPGDQISITPALNFYSYPNQEESPATIELSLKAELALGKYFNFVNDISADIWNYKGLAYGLHLLEFSNTLFEETEYKITAGFGWANKKFNEDLIGISKMSVNYFHFGAEVSIPYKENFELVPFTEYQLIAPKDFRNIIGSNFFNIGLKLQAAF